LQQNAHFAEFFPKIPDFSVFKLHAYSQLILNIKFYKHLSLMHTTHMNQEKRASRNKWHIVS